jgi:hypothetical protein
MEAWMTGPHKVRIKIGDAEFEAEGSEESVKQQYADFLAALAVAGPQKAPKADGAKGNNQQDAAEPDKSALTRLFQVDGDLVSLKFLPKTETATPDALMLLLLGYALLKNQEMVLGTQLTRAARQSGLAKIERVDRAFGKYGDDFLQRGGAKKGTRYGLNNQGTNKAKELLAMMLE